MQLFSKEKHIIHILLSEQVPFDIGQKPKVKKTKKQKRMWNQNVFKYDRLVKEIIICFAQNEDGSQSRWLNAHCDDNYNTQNFASWTSSHTKHFTADFFFLFVCLLFVLQDVSALKLLFRVIYSRLSILDFVLHIIENCAKALIKQYNGAQKQMKVHCVLVWCIGNCLL